MPAWTTIKNLFRAPEQPQPELTILDTKFRNQIAEEYRGQGGAKKKTYAESRLIHQKYGVQARGAKFTRSAEDYRAQVGTTFHTFDHGFSETSEMIVLAVQNMSKGQHVRMDPDQMPALPPDHVRFNIPRIMKEVDRLRVSKAEDAALQDQPAPIPPAQ